MLMVGYRGLIKIDDDDDDDDDGDDNDDIMMSITQFVVVYIEFEVQACQE